VKLTAVKVRNAKLPGRYGDGRGLMLVVGGDGSRKWVLRVQVRGRRRDIGLGAAADVTLADAREAAEDMRRAIRAGRDPVADRRAGQVPTFEAAARRVHAEHSPGWRNAKHRAEWLTTLERFVFPSIGSRPVSEIDAGAIRDALVRIWLDKPETARRVRQRVGVVLDYAHGKGWRDSEAPMRGVIRALPRQRDKVAHHAASPWRQVPALLAGPLACGCMIRLALTFCVLTAARTGEVRFARWDEFDLGAKLWTVPAARMKAGREHRVPLSTPAVTIIERAATLHRAGPYVFEGRGRGRPLGERALHMTLQRSGVVTTVHGFRSAFRDWCSEAGGVPREVAEAALAHVLSNRTEAAYARTDHLDRRRVVMDDWAAFCLPSGAAVAYDAHNTDKSQRTATDDEQACVQHPRTGRSDRNRPDHDL